MLLRLDCKVSGRASTRVARQSSGRPGPTGLASCAKDSDETGGLNKPGDVILHVPDNHQMSVIAKERAGWLRCRLNEAPPDVPTYVESPTVINVEAYTIGGTAPTVNAEVVHGEILGRSDGTPAQRFALQRRPVVASDVPMTLTVLVGEEEQIWNEVQHFALSVQRIGTSESTRTPVRSISGRQCARSVEVFSVTAISRRRARCCASTPTGPVVANSGTSPAARCGC